MNCEPNHTQQIYRTPITDYQTWSEDKLEQIYQLVQSRIEQIDKPVLVILEVGHFKLPKEEKNFTWAMQNAEFADRLTGKLIRHYGRSVRFLVTLLINNLESEVQQDVDAMLEVLFSDKRYIQQKSLKILSERNLKNRAYKALKNNSKLADSFIHIDGKAYLKDEEYQHDLAAGFVNENGDIIPRCGLILTSFLDKLADLAYTRMFPNKEFETVFISFCEEYHEYQRVKLGVDIYCSTHNNITINPIVLHWDYSRDCCLISYRHHSEKTWHDSGIEDV